MSGCRPRVAAGRSVEAAQRLAVVAAFV